MVKLFLALHYSLKIKSSPLILQGKVGICRLIKRGDYMFSSSSLP